MPILSPPVHRHLPILSPLPHQLLPSHHLPVLSPSPTTHNMPTIHPATTNSAISKSQSLPSVSSVSHLLSLLFAYLGLSRLKDQAIKSLCDIWPHQDIPTVFLTSSRPLVSPSSAAHHPHVANIILSTSRNTHLPSPISPSTQPTPVISPVVSHPPYPVVCPQLQRCDFASMKGFVHQVLRRSRTSGTVLQTALCYLEAIRSKVPDLIRKENHAFSSSFPVASHNDRIYKGEVGIDFDTDLGDPALSLNVSTSNSLLSTVRVNPMSHEANASFLMESALNTDRASAHKSRTNNVSLPPLPSLPSPLLCPRRTFLASLILASKFMQDRCYSNRAWAKLSGLPPREIGRCERALGEALEWRLWVGKLPAAQPAQGRALTKSKSESDIHLSGSTPRAHVTNDMDAPFCNTALSAGSRNLSLRRHATVPPGSLYLEGPRVGGSDNVSPTAYSSSPSTPGLSYSPTPTESSLGDRTVQMTTFMDVSTPPPGQFATFTGAQNDKMLAALPVPSTSLFVHTSSQEMGFPSLSQRIDPQYWVSHGVTPSSIWMFNDDV